MRTILLALTLLLAGCLTNDDDGPATAMPEDGMDVQPEEVPLALFEGPGVGVPPATMGIRPSTLELAAGMPYRLVLTNEGRLPHNLVIEGLDVETDVIASGATLEVDLLPREPGTYVMYCAVGGDGPTGHRAQGMVGEVIVA